ncbi:MAG TPA: hypothetical protein VHJ69_02355 [Gemmatimonadales bacterium]|nr:hypothetical protein [Gemmatimonadales bacterium]
MKTPEHAGPIEPSVEAIVTVRQRLHQMGFLLSDDAARDLLRDVLLVESARLDRRAREAATACLRSIQDAAQEAVRILTQGGPVTRGAEPAAAFAPPVSPPPPPPRQRQEGVDLADVVRRRLGDDVPSEPHPRRPDDTPPPGGPRRPVFKGRRGR